MELHDGWDAEKAAHVRTVLADLKATGDDLLIDRETVRVVREAYRLIERLVAEVEHLTRRLEASGGGGG